MRVSNFASDIFSPLMLNFIITSNTTNHPGCAKQPKNIDRPSVRYPVRHIDR